VRFGGTTEDTEDTEGNCGWRGVFWVELPPHPRPLSPDGGEGRPVVGCAMEYEQEEWGAGVLG